MKEEIREREYKYQQYEISVQNEALGARRNENNPNDLDQQMRDQRRKGAEEYRQKTRFMEQQLSNYKEVAKRGNTRQVYDLGIEIPQNNMRPQELTHGEYAVVNWYYGLYGEQWRLIADILSYHPLSRGRLRHKDAVQQLYKSFIDQNVPLSLEAGYRRQTPLA